MSEITVTRGNPVEVTVVQGDPVVIELSYATGGTGTGISDGDKGDVTVSGSGSTWTIDSGAVTFAKMQAVSANVLLGNDAIGTTVQEIACTSAGRDLLDDADAAAQRTTLGLGTLATQSGTFSGTSSGTNTGDQTITLTGDVTGSGTGSFAATIANDAVTFAKMQNVATGVLLGRATSGTGDVETITCTAAGRAILDDADAAAQRATLSAAPNSAGYLVTQPTPELGNATDLGSLATGLLKSTSTLGVASISIATGTDLPSHTHSAADITSGTLGISRGGTGQTTKTAAFDALSPQTTKGDLIAFDGSDAVRLAVGATNGHVLTVDSTAATGVAWAAAVAGSTVTVSESTYTSSGTYTKPVGLQYIIVEGVGGGGGGGAGSTTAGGNGGCAGLYSMGVIAAATITTSTLTVTIGTGGGAGVAGGDSEVTLASGGARLLYMPGGRAATNDMRNLTGGVTTNGFGAGQTAANATAGRHGGYGPGGGGPGNTTAANAAGLAGGRPSSHEFTGGNAQVGGGAAGGAAGGGAGTNASVTVRGFGEGAGGGGANTGGAGGAGGNGTRGSGGGGGGRGSTAGGAGGSGGDGFIRIIEVVVT